VKQRVRCCCPCLCDFQADMPPRLPGVQFMHAPRCPECSEAQKNEVEEHSGQAVVHGGIHYYSPRYARSRFPRPQPFELSGPTRTVSGEL